MKRQQSEVGDLVRPDANESWRNVLRDKNNIVRKHSSTSVDNRDGCQSAPCELVDSSLTDETTPLGRINTIDTIRDTSICESTKRVEFLSDMTAAKVHRKVHFSGCTSLMNCVDSAAAQDNLSMTYLDKVSLCLGASPSKKCDNLAIKPDTLRQRHNEKENILPSKKRRLEKNLTDMKQNDDEIIRECTAYTSGEAIAHMYNITGIPNPRVEPATERLSEEIFTNSKQIFCDIETTSFGYDADIVQIAAVCGESKFNQYIMPLKGFHPKASAKTGLSTNGHELFYNGKPEATLPSKDALQLFLAWLKKHAQCVLIGHNFKTFDFPRIVRAFEIVGLTNDFKQCVTGIIDTLILFKKFNPCLPKYNQESLVSFYLKESYEAHNALGDVESLQKLCTTVGILDNQMLSSYSIESAWNWWHYRRDGKQNAKSLMILKKEKVLSKVMIDRIANSGLCLCHLKLVVSRSGIFGLQQLCKESVNGKPRVTNRPNIITKLFDYLKK